jgi:hypothetical protein
MLSRWQGALAATVVTLVAGVLVVLDLTDVGLQHWWDVHALTTDTVAGLLVLMITVLVADQVIRLKQAKKRARAVAVQAAILMAQANRAWQAVSQIVAGSGDPQVAFEEFRTYTMMLLSVAPVLIDDKTSRTFLEQGQLLDGEMALVLSVLSEATGGRRASPTRLNETLESLRSASVPLLKSMSPEMRSAVLGDDRA